MNEKIELRILQNNDEFILYIQRCLYIYVFEILIAWYLILITNFTRLWNGSSQIGIERNKKYQTSNSNNFSVLASNQQTQEILVVIEWTSFVKDHNFMLKSDEVNWTNIHSGHLKFRFLEKTGANLEITAALVECVLNDIFHKLWTIIW